jgi:hypothetical protein
LKERSTPYISLLETFRNAARGSSLHLYFEAADEAHLNAAGHSLGAQVVAAALVHSGSVPINGADASSQ